MAININDYSWSINGNSCLKNIVVWLKFQCHGWRPLLFGQGLGLGKRINVFTCFYLFLSVFSSSAHVCDTKNGHFETVSFLAMMSQILHQKVS